LAGTSSNNRKWASAMAQSPREQTPRTRDSRQGIIAAVNTPLGFFSLVVLIVDSAIGVFAASSPASDRTPLLWAMAGIMCLVTVVVATLEYLRPGSLTGKRPRIHYSVVISAPADMPGFDISQISWVDGKCFLAVRKKRVPINPAPGDAGVSFEIRIPADLFEEIDATDPVRFELVDAYDLRWEVGPFFVHQRPSRLVPRSKQSEILAKYRSDE
jgi:hypothetical protein